MANHDFINITCLTTIKPPDNFPLIGKCFCGKLKQRFTDRDIDVNRTKTMMPDRQQGLIYQTVAVPAFLVVTRFRQTDSLPDKAPQRIRLRQRLTILLVNPLWRSVGRNNNQRHLLVICLGHGGQQIEQCRTTGDTNSDCPRSTGT